MLVSRTDTAPNTLCAHELWPQPPGGPQGPPQRGEPLSLPGAGSGREHVGGACPGPSETCRGRSSLASSQSWLPLRGAKGPEDLGNGAGSHIGPGAAGEPCRPLSGAAGDSVAQGLGLGGAHASAPPPTALWPCPGPRGKQLVEKHPKPNCSLCSTRDKHPSIFRLSIHPSFPKYLLSICYMHDTILKTKV